MRVRFDVQPTKALAFTPTSLYIWLSYNCTSHKFAKRYYTYCRCRVMEFSWCEMKVIKQCP